MKFILSCILIYMHVCLARNIKTNKHFLRIMGGRNATADEFPYAVKMLLQSIVNGTQRNNFICTGAVLTSKWTLTAAHCIRSMEQQISIATIQRKGMVEYQPSLKAEFAYSEIMTTAIHPNFQFDTARNDIGLLRTQPVLSATYGKLSPLDYATLNGQQVSLIGFGMIMIHGSEESLPKLPMILEVIVKECSNIFYNYPQLCFAPSCLMNVHDSRGLVALCKGDSGGPAVHASGIVSVNTISYLRNCGLGSRIRDRYDTGYHVGTATPVSPFIDWISSVIKTEIV